MVTGGGSRLRGFNDLLAKQTHMKTRQATIGPGVNIAGNGFNASDALDVISIVSDAALLGATECTMMPPQTVIENDPTDTGNTTPGITADNKPRISRQFTSDADDDNLLVDDYDPNDDPAASADDSRQVNDNSKADTAEKNTSSKFWTKLSKQLTNMLKDDDEFEN